jgi:AraC family transcriptional activator of pyochelin receptor
MTDLEKNNHIGTFTVPFEPHCFHFNRKLKCDCRLQAGKIHFLLCLNQDVNIQFNTNYQRTLPASQAFIIYNPQAEFTAVLNGLKGGTLVCISLSFDALHQRFMPYYASAPNWPIFEMAKAGQRLYEQVKLTNELCRLIFDFSAEWQQEPARHLVQEGLIMQILGNLLSPVNEEQSSCPYLKDHRQVQQIKQIKEFLLNHLNNPPTLTQIAKMFNINIQHLKTRFKSVYGMPVYGFILNAKLEQAHYLLYQHQYSVKEAASAVGYHNTSQFISAYKKKYHNTPKQYLKTLNK